MWRDEGVPVPEAQGVGVTVMENDREGVGETVRDPPPTPPALLLLLLGVRLDE